MKFQYFKLESLTLFFPQQLQNKTITVKNLSLEKWNEKKSEYIQP